jgi:glyoxylase-like metal-dependent hydrolase (beta-lactamase superfamily II)
MNWLPLSFCLLLPLNALAARITDPHLPDTAPKRISAHVWEIEGFPNVGIVVGRNATLVVDTGLGPRNGEIVARQAAKLKPGAKLYLVTTHFHAEHTSGDGGFPAGTVIVRSRVQQEELDRGGAAMITRFRSRAENVEFLPEGLTLRRPDVLFDQEYSLDLGGVHARVVVVGPAHTLGDQVIWIPEDRTLLTGDLAMDNDPPQRFAAGADAKVWIAALDRLAAFKPLHVVPDHGDPGDISLISREREFLSK